MGNQDGDSSNSRGCPVDHAALGTQQPLDSSTPNTTASAPHASGSCPVDHTKRQSPSFMQSLFGSKPTPPPSNSECPVDHQGASVNPLNMMPDLPQDKHESQSASLSTKREISTIPRADQDSQWEYPSPQQFYNALARKNMAAPEEYVDVMVDIHNFLNEGAWNEVLKWEKRHTSECMQPKLIRLQGRPRDLSPLARMYSWIYGVKPFDRHDWYVDRCGKQVRYVIDYYEGYPQDDMPVFNLVVRPAIDDAGSLVDRAKQLWQDAKEQYFSGSSSSGSSSSSKE
ncbi:holocytochrome c synthase [Coemansia brasiliensis]|uniref:Holocytochrome c-type synthase n=1 Tax=Coemansia brasiliensis TaxID=2650707 RepID=A0A9W8LYV0_9FUNG|nr:holocytochrome c synthase [Coemansia brasiliensis]